MANLLTSERFTNSEPILRRSINAALRVGSDIELNNLIAFAKRKQVSKVLRGEALAALATWASPSVLDRVDGRFRGEIYRDSSIVKTKLIEDIPSFLEDRDSNILVGISNVLKLNGIDSFNNKLYQIY